LDTVFQAEKLPAGVTNLDTGLTNVNRDDFTHDEKECVVLGFLNCLKVVCVLRENKTGFAFLFISI